MTHRRRHIYIPALLGATMWAGAAMAIPQAQPSDADSAVKEQLSEALDMMGAGDDEGARELLLTLRDMGVAEANLYLGRLAFRDYDFPAAQEYYGLYAKAYQRPSKPSGKTKPTGKTSGKGQSSDKRVEAEAEGRIDTDAIPLAAEYRRYTAQLAEAEKQLERVEDITILDSIVVPFDDFYRYYRLPQAAGRLLMPTELPDVADRDLVSMGFANDAANFAMWAQPDSLGVMRIVQSERMVDGHWTAPLYTPSTLNGGGDADFPFLTLDGTMLYFASDGDGSIGGMDIFMASRDPRTGEYMLPTSMGMPINSPYDDYMLAIDEDHGVGWWATDRNRLGDSLTLYIYRLPELRENIPAEADAVSRARISNLRDSWSEDSVEVAENEALISRIRQLDDTQSQRGGSILWPMPGGEVYRSLSDFGSDATRRLVLQYIDLERKQEREVADLQRMRREYYEASEEENVDQSQLRQLGELIRELELSVDHRRDKMKHLRSDIYRAEEGR